MPPSHHQALIERIHASATPLVIAVTGGGSGAIAELLEVPGASATVIEAVVPYSPAALCDWLGGQPDQASERTARAMAMGAFQRARELSDADPRTLRGIGATASLATNRAKRGPHRIHVAWQSADRTVAVSHEFTKGELSRSEEEQIATQLVLDAVAEACGVEAGSWEQGAGSKKQGTGSISPAVRREVCAASEWTELLLGERIAVAVEPPPAAGTTYPQSERSFSAAAGNPRSPILFPGAFNPVHAGHERMAAIAAKRLGAPVTWEVSIVNVDKPPLDFIEINDRLAGLAGRCVLLTRAATFVEKSSLAPGCTFVVGADTIERIADPSYYGGDVARRNAAVAAIAERGCRFLVFGRLIGGRFHSSSNSQLPPALSALCDDVPQSEFCQDVASSELRGEARSSLHDR